ncbi:hypothetical protein ZIOFF_075163 [Zingiber officinale]|uniref:Uncharacterized protein n=1 Tax=Zingiber officinale TaxID=94328 RepID=A0A8J5ERM0_ZINOF|nr:hypothetical protein ZIOFF_075163 [Zingiber officinale]
MGLLESILGKDGRRLMKRKDSDAREQGRALEELRSSLYSDIHTLEGAKHKSYVVMGKVGFNFPVALSLIHYVTSWLLIAIFKALSLLPASPPSKTTPFSSLFVLGAVMAMATELANCGLLSDG